MNFNGSKSKYYKIKIVTPRSTGSSREMLIYEYLKFEFLIRFCANIILEQTIID